MTPDEAKEYEAARCLFDTLVNDPPPLTIEARDSVVATIAASVPPLLRRDAKDDGIANAYVYFPVLLEQFDGDVEAAEVAWGLGMRPAGYPST